MSSNTQTLASVVQSTSTGRNRRPSFWWAGRQILIMIEAGVQNFLKRYSITVRLSSINRHLCPLLKTMTCFGEWSHADFDHNHRCLLGSTCLGVILINRRLIDRIFFNVFSFWLCRPVPSPILLKNCLVRFSLHYFRDACDLVPIILFQQITSSIRHWSWSLPLLRTASSGTWKDFLRQNAVRIPTDHVGTTAANWKRTHECRKETYTRIPKLRYESADPIALHLFRKSSWLRKHDTVPTLSQLRIVIRHIF